MSLNSDLRGDVIECIVDCPLMVGFENHGDKTPNLASRIFARFDMVETGIIQGVDQEKWLDMIKKMVELRQGGQLIDIWKEIYKSVNTDQRYQYGRIIKDLIAQLSSVCILDVEKLSGKGQVFANFDNVVDAAQRRWTKFKRAVADNRPWLANKAERDFNLILRDYAGQHKAIIQRCWGDEFLEELLKDKDLRNRYMTIRTQFNKVRDDAMNKAQGLAKMHTAMKSMHENKDKEMLNQFTTLEFEVAETLEELVTAFKVIIKHPNITNDQRCNYVWEVLEKSPARMKILSRLMTTNFSLEGAKSEPIAADFSDIKNLQRKVANWTLERVRKGDIDTHFDITPKPEFSEKFSTLELDPKYFIQQHIKNVNGYLALIDQQLQAHLQEGTMDCLPDFTHSLPDFILRVIGNSGHQKDLCKALFPWITDWGTSPEKRTELIRQAVKDFCSYKFKEKEHASLYKHADRDQVIQPWDKNHASWYGGKSEEKEKEMTPKEDFIKTIFADVLKSSEFGAIAKYEQQSPENKEAVDKLIDALYENFVKPTMSKINETETNGNGKPREAGQKLNLQYNRPAFEPVIGYPVNYADVYLGQPSTETRQIQLPSGQVVTIQGAKGDPMLDQLAGIFTSKIPVTPVSDVKHVIDFTAFNLYHRVVYKEDLEQVEVQISLVGSGNALKTIFTCRAINLDQALNVYKCYKEVLIQTCNIDQALVALHRHFNG